MRLAIVRQSYNPYGGAERFVERALQALRDAGEPLEITLIARRWHGEAHSADALLRCEALLHCRWRRTPMLTARLPRSEKTPMRHGIPDDILMSLFRLSARVR